MRFTANPTVITALIAAGANPNERMVDGMTPLHFAVALKANTSPGVIAALLEAGGDPNMRTELDKTPWDLAQNGV